MLLLLLWVCLQPVGGTHAAEPMQQHRLHEHRLVSLPLVAALLVLPAGMVGGLPTAVCISVY